MSRGTQGPKHAWTADHYREGGGRTVACRAGSSWISECWTFRAAGPAVLLRGTARLVAGSSSAWMEPGGSEPLGVKIGYTRLNESGRDLILSCVSSGLQAALPLFLLLLRRRRRQRLVAAAVLQQPTVHRHQQGRRRRRPMAHREP